MEGVGVGLVGLKGHSPPNQKTTNAALVQRNLMTCKYCVSVVVLLVINHL